MHNAHMLVFLGNILVLFYLSVLGNVARAHIHLFFAANTTAVKELDIFPTHVLLMQTISQAQRNLKLHVFGLQKLGF